MRVLHARDARLGDRAAAPHPDPSDDEIRIGLSGNLCRCTGYRGIVRAVRQAASGEVPPLPAPPEPPEPVPDATPPHRAA